VAYNKYFDRADVRIGRWRMRARGCEAAREAGIERRRRSRLGGIRSIPAEYDGSMLHTRERARRCE